jgi:hypothetical protein
MNYKVFKRPMFRYGGSSWQGTGITAGLDTPPRIDLAEGGRTIGGGTIHGTPMGNRTGFATPYVEGYNRIQWNKPPRTPLNITKIAEVGSTGSTTGSTTANTAKNTVKKVIEKIASKTNQGVWKFNERAVAKWLLNAGRNTALRSVATAGIGAASWPIVASAAILYGAAKLAPILEGPMEALTDELEKAGALDPLSPNFAGQFGFGTAVVDSMEAKEEEKARQEFFEKDEPIGPVPPESLDIETVLKESNGKETEIYSSEIEESKLLDKDMDNSIKLIKDQENNAIGSSLNEKEKASATTGGEMPLFDKIYGAQEADIKRNAWLTLAKFGARLMEKPVGVAAEESLTDFEKIAKEKRDLRTITTMKEAEWEHQKELKLMADLTKNPSKMAEYIEHLTAKFMRENKDWGIEKARIAATNHALKYGSSQTKALLDQAQDLAKRLSTANAYQVVNSTYDKFGWKMLLDDNIGTENMIRLPIKTKKVKKIVDGKKQKVDEETYDFKNLEGQIIKPGMFYFVDEGTNTGTIYQYTGEGAITNWNDVLSADAEGTWKIYLKD